MLYLSMSVSIFTKILINYKKNKLHLVSLLTFFPIILSNC
jgi:hypothetical protein